MNLIEKEDELLRDWKLLADMTWITRMESENLQITKTTFKKWKMKEMDTYTPQSPVFETDVPNETTSSTPSSKLLDNAMSYLNTLKLISVKRIVMP